MTSALAWPLVLSLSLSHLLPAALEEEDSLCGGSARLCHVLACTSSAARDALLEHLSARLLREASVEGNDDSALTQATRCASLSWSPPARVPHFVSLVSRALLSLRVSATPLARAQPAVAVRPNALLAASSPPPAAPAPLQPPRPHAAPAPTRPLVAPGAGLRRSAPVRVGRASHRAMPVAAAVRFTPSRKLVAAAVPLPRLSVVYNDAAARSPRYGDETTHTAARVRRAAHVTGCAPNALAYVSLPLPQPLCCEESSPRTPPCVRWSWHVHRCGPVADAGVLLSLPDACAAGESSVYAAFNLACPNAPCQLLTPPLSSSTGIQLVQSSCTPRLCVPRVHDAHARALTAADAAFSSPGTASPARTPPPVRTPPPAHPASPTSRRRVGGEVDAEEEIGEVELDALNDAACTPALVPVCGDSAAYLTLSFEVRYVSDDGVAAASDAVPSTAASGDAVAPPAACGGRMLQLRMTSRAAEYVAHIRVPAVARVIPHMTLMLMRGESALLALGDVRVGDRLAARGATAADVAACVPPANATSAVAGTKRRASTALHSLFAQSSSDDAHDAHTQDAASSSAEEDDARAAAGTDAPRAFENELTPRHRRHKQSTGAQSRVHQTRSAVAGGAWVDDCEDVEDDADWG